MNKGILQSNDYKFQDDDSTESITDFNEKNYTEELNYMDFEDDDEELEKQLDRKRTLLEDRLNSLQVTMTILKEQLNNEKMMWKTELEETLKMTSAIESNVATAQETDSIVADSLEAVRSSVDCLSSRDYQNRVSQYEEAILRSQAERRVQLKRQLSLNNYRRRLMEVENMCNLELLRVKQSVQYLQPLQVMVSEWKFSEFDEIQGFAKEETNSKKGYSSSDDSRIDSQLVIEKAASNKTCNDMNRLYTNIPYHTLRKSSSSIWQTEDELNTKSSVWSQTDFTCSRTSLNINSSQEKL